MKKREQKEKSTKEALKFGGCRKSNPMGHPDSS